MESGTDCLYQSDEQKLLVLAEGNKQLAPLLPPQVVSTLPTNSGIWWPRSYLGGNFNDRNERKNI